MKLIRNAIITPDGTFLRSMFLHISAFHKDEITGFTYMVDGGINYQHISSDGQHVDASLYDDEPHDIQRLVVSWWSYGKDGDEPYHEIKIANMGTDHIKTVLAECDPSDVIYNCMAAELEWRKADYE